MFLFSGHGLQSLFPDVLLCSILILQDPKFFMSVSILKLRLPPKLILWFYVYFQVTDKNIKLRCAKNCVLWYAAEKSCLIISASLQSHVEVYQFPIQSTFAAYFLCLGKSTWTTLSNYTVISLNNSPLPYSHFLLLILCLLERLSSRPRAAI